VLAIGISTPSLAYARATAFTTNERIPFDREVFVECAADGAGELVHLTGTLHDLFHITLDNSGGFHLKGQDNPQGVSGTGETTGDKYQATGVTKFEFNGKVGFEQTFVNNLHIIGQGNGNNLLVHETIHVTVHADGTVTAFVDNVSIECK
jgi:hypothetical protein